MSIINNNELFKSFEEKDHEITKFISPITNADQDLYESYIQQPEDQTIKERTLNFENSFEYIRMYFNSGRYRGFKYHDGAHLIVFALEEKKKPRFKLFKPLGKGAFTKLPEIVSMLCQITDYPLQTVCLGNNDLSELKKLNSIQVKTVKEFNYYTYDLETMGDLVGNKWKNVRQKVAAFRKNHPKLKMERLGGNNYEAVIHFIGAWRRQLLSARRLSYSNLEKNKFAARYYSNKNDFEQIWATVYRHSGRVVGFQLLYRLGVDCAAHAIGLTDTTLPGLSETAQVDTWRQVQRSGVRFINDGASWRPGLDRYKRKFNPVGVQRVFECKIRTK